MDEIWERAVELALDGQTDHAAARTLTLDGAVKCVQGWLPPLSLLEKFENLQHLSVANIGVSSLEQFPRLRNLQKLILSDNCIPGGLEFLVEAGLDSLRDLDLSNNRIQFLEDLAPLAQLKLISLDLYECPVTRVKDYRSRVFGLIKSLKYLDKMDAEENERPESDDEEDEEEEDEDDPGSGEIDGDERPFRLNNGHSEGAEGIVDADDESDADEETETGRRVDGFRVAAVEVRDDVDDEEGDDDYENESGEEIDEEEGDDDDDDDDDDVVEVHEIEDSDDEVDGVEDEDDDEEDDDEEEDELEEVDNDEAYFAEPVSTGRVTSTEGEIDAHEHGEEEDDDDNDNGETGEEEQGVEDDGEFEDEEYCEEDEEEDSGYLVQPVGQAEVHDAGGSDGEVGIEEEEDPEGEEEVEDDEEVEVVPSSSSSSQQKRKRDEEDLDEDDEDDDEEEDNDVVEYNKSSKKQR